MNALVSAHSTTAHYKTTIDNGRQLIIADEPTNEGGTDLGPTPMELLAGALASCTNITLRLYADRKEWPLEDIETKVEVVLEGKETRIHREVKLHGPLSEEQRERIMQIADKCPVHKVLSHNAIIETVLWS